MKKLALLVNIGAPRGWGKYFLFAFRMFADENILPLPAVLRFPASFFASLFRTPVAMKKYSLIGGSPLLSQMKRQSKALEGLLDGVCVEPAMLYSEPLLQDVLKKSGAQEIVVIPLFPHFSISTTGALISKLQKLGVRARVVKSFHDHPLFIELWRKAVLKLWEGEPVLFAAHAIPHYLLLKGDPYKGQVIKSAYLLAEALGAKEFAIGFQSALKVGSWIGPSAEDALKDLRKKAKKVLVVPIGFLNEHLETLYDLDIELKELAFSLGFEVYKRVPVPWKDKLLLQLLAQLVEEADYV